MEGGWEMERCCRKKVPEGGPSGPGARGGLRADGPGVATSPHRQAVLHREAFTPGRVLPFQPLYGRAFRPGGSYPRSALVVQP